MSEQPIITVVGPGVMGEAIIAGLLRNGLTVPEKIRASGPIVERGEEMEERYGVKALYDNRVAVDGARAVILSVKPQQLEWVLSDLQGKIDPDSVVLSIIAGAPMAMIAEGLDHKSVVRAMPNTPAQIGEGISVWTALPDVTPKQLEMARNILAALGQEIEVDEEYYLDMATALSGSGPAYIYLFMEAMIDAGVHLGFPRRIAEQLVVQTLRGSVDYYEMKKSHPAHLRNEVTSPGGTSAAALYYLEKAGIRTAISRAIWAAFERSQELGRGMASKPPENNKD